MKGVKQTPLATTSQEKKIKKKNKQHKKINRPSVSSCN